MCYVYCRIRYLCNPCPAARTSFWNSCILSSPFWYPTASNSNPLSMYFFSESTNAPSQLYGINRERNVLFNDTLNTFYLRLYGVKHMVKDHSDSEKGNPLSPHNYSSINSKGSFICIIPQTG